MRTKVRLLAIVLALPLLGVWVAGGHVHLLAEEKRESARQSLIERFPEGSRGAVESFVKLPVAVHGMALGVAVLLLGFGFWPAGGGARKKAGKSAEAKEGRASKQVGVAEAEPKRAGSAASGLSRKEVKRILRLAKTMEDEHGPEAAGDFLLDEGLSEEASALFEREGLLERLAEVLHDQNRFEEAAEAYERCERWESAGSIYQQLDKLNEAGRCYVKAEKHSVAGEIFERAENYREAGKCYRDIGFHRHAAQAFLKGNLEAEAAQSLVAAFDDEGGGAAAASEQAAREQRSLAKKAGDLFLKLERFEEAESIYLRSGAHGSAAKVAFHTGAYDRAAELFLRVGRGDLAAQALQKLDKPVEAAKALGEYLRDKGKVEEAVAQLEKAGEFQEAGDLYRRLERWEESGNCYWKVGEYAAAAEMFRVGGLPRRSAEAYEKIGQFDQAARCMGQAGESLLQAQLMEKAGDYFSAGRAYHDHGEIDEAIRVLQLVEPNAANFAEVCAFLGGLFEQKGMHSLSVKKFEEATDGQPVSRENVAAYFQLAGAYVGREEFAGGVEIYEKILAFDYHYQDVGQRLEQAKQARDAQPAAGVESAAQQAAGRYQVLREIGRGGMGVVFLATDTVLERQVAFKVLPEQLRENLNALKNFLREAKAAAQLNHPNIVTVYDAGESEHGFYLAMELVEGTTLKEIVQRRGAVSPGGVIYVLRQMAEALAYAHSKNVVHRDIKTANTMWTPTRQVKIMDFGLAKLMAEVRNATTVVSGTPFYMSPEQTLGKNVDHRTDLYSLGVTLFELATGELPFRKGNVPYHHVHTPPPSLRSLNDKVPEALERIILRCMSKSPDERYQSARDLIAAAEDLESGGGGA